MHDMPAGNVAMSPALISTGSPPAGSAAEQVQLRALSYR
jgi:hypothetical protein